MKFRTMVAISLLAIVSTAAIARPLTTAEKNKDVVIRFYNALAHGDIATVRELGRPDYIQHNPSAATGLQGVIDFFQSRPPQPAGTPPAPPLQFVRVIADDSFVMTLQRIAPLPTVAGQPAPPPDGELALVDIFRIQDGKVAEHWDYFETFPRGNTPPKNNNGRF